MTTVRLELAPDSDPATAGRGVERAVLRQRVEQLLSANAQADRTLRSKGAFTPVEAETLKQAASVGLVKGLLKVEIEDPYSRSRRIEFYGDDDGETWHQFANPVKVGKFAQVDKSVAAAPSRPARAFYEAGY